LDRLSEGFYNRIFFLVAGCAALEDMALFPRSPTLPLVVLLILTLLGAPLDDEGTRGEGFRRGAEGILLPWTAGWPAAPAQQGSTCSAEPGFCTISSRSGWQRVPMEVRRGDRFFITQVTGEWTVDTRQLPYVGPYGYSPPWDVTICCPQMCKTAQDYPYGALLIRLGDGTRFPPFGFVGEGEYRAVVDGPVYLQINDECRGDDDGALRMRVSVATTPTPTATSTPTATPSRTTTPTATVTPSMTLTPTPSVTATPIPSATSTPTASATSTATPSATWTPTATATPRPTYPLYLPYLRQW
jgi:hypothetical protein